MKYLICCLFLLFTLNSEAQPKVSNVVLRLFSDIEDIEVTIHNIGGVTGYYTKVNITRENSKWYAKCRKMDFSEKNPNVIDSITREVAPDSIKFLIHYLLNPNPVIKTSLFKLNRDALIKYYRTSQNASKQITEEKFLRIIDDPVSLRNSLISVAYSRIQIPNEPTYEIIVRLSKGPDLIAVSQSATFPYSLPWKLNGIKNYNPNITKSLDYFSGNANWESNRRIWLYISLVDQLGRPSLGN